MYTIIDHYTLPFCSYYHFSNIRINFKVHKGAIFLLYFVPLRLTLYMQNLLTFDTELLHISIYIFSWKQTKFKERYVRNFPFHFSLFVPPVDGIVRANKRWRRALYKSNALSFLLHFQLVRPIPIIFVWNVSTVTLNQFTAYVTLSSRSRRLKNK